MLSPFRLSEKNMPQKANEIALILKDKEWHNRTKLAETVGLTEGQLSVVIKFMRRSSETDLGRYIAFYPISSLRGYKFCKNWEEFAPYYITMRSRAESIMRTIKPVEEKMNIEKINWLEYLPEEMDPIQYSEYLESLPAMGKDSWFMG